MIRLLIGILVPSFAVTASLDFQNSNNDHPTLLSRIAALEQKVDMVTELQARLRGQERQITDLQTLAGEQAATIRDQDLAIHQLKVKVAQQSREMSALTAELEKLGTGHDAVADTSPERNENSDKQGVPVPLTRNLKRGLGIRQTDHVGFTAYLDHNVNHLGINQTLIFNHILTNESGAYNASLGQFLCPETGLYLFYFSVAHYGPQELVAKLVVDGKNQVDAIADPMQGTQDVQAGNLAILHLAAGQSVWVSNYLNSDDGVRSDNQVRYATFSGLMLV